MKKKAQRHRGAKAETPHKKMEISMRLKYFQKIFILFFILVCTTVLMVRICSAQGSEDCDKAKAFYIRAVNSKDLQEKLSNYIEAARLCPRSGKVQTNLADTYEKLGQFDKAIEGYKLAIDLFKDLPHTPAAERAVPHFGLGDVYLQTGQFRGAIEAYMKGLELEPDNDWTLKNLKEAKQQLVKKVGLIKAEEIVRRLTDRAITVMGPAGIRKKVRRVAFPTILFDTDKAALRKESYGQLREISLALAAEKLKSCCFIIEGHTDNSGGFQHNMGLSHARASTVQSHLINQGKLKAERFEVRAFGYTRPRESNNMKWGMAQNRRVELVLIE